MSNRFIYSAIFASLIVLTGVREAAGQCSQNPMAIICDDFESYTTGLISPQSTWWTPWSPPEDGILSAVVTTEKASQGTQSMKVTWVQSGSTQGNDQILLLGGKTTGKYELKWKEMIPSGHAGYLNIQNSQTVGVKWNLDIYFDSTNIARMIINPVGTNQTPNATFSFPKDKWFAVRFVFDLDNNIAKLFIDDVLVLGWAYPDNLGGIDFYAATTWDLVYIDELEYVGMPAGVFNPDICSSAVDLTQYFGQPPAVAQTTGIYDNTHATVSASDPNITCWNEPAGVQILNNTMWYTFNGDGNKYHIETVPCSSTNYIGSSLPIINSSNPAGDTQMAIFSGADCSSLTMEACNDDLNPNGEPDWRAGLDLQTAPTKNYYMLIDGYNYGNGLVATGQYCIQVTRIPNITCDQGKIGTYSISNHGYVCYGSDVSGVITLGTGYTIPDIGPVYGMSWAITTQEVPDGVWPPTMGSSYVDATIFAPDPFVLSSPDTYGQIIERYFTPVIVAGGFIYNPSNPPRMNNVNPANGCFFTGQSGKITFLPILNPLNSVISAVPASAQGDDGKAQVSGFGGGIADLTGDPSTYLFKWNTGDTTQSISHLAPGNYTVTISDISGCTLPLVLTTEVAAAVREPGSIASFSVNPNPAPGEAQVEVKLKRPAEVTMEVLNETGQVLQILKAGTTDAIRQRIDLSNQPNGIYFIRLSVDGAPAVRRLTLQR